MFKPWFKKPTILSFCSYLGLKNCLYCVLISEEVAKGEKVIGGHNLQKLNVILLTNEYREINDRLLNL